MGFIEDMLKEVPLSAVLKERVALAEQRYAHVMSENLELKKRVEALERQNAELKAQVPVAKQSQTPQVENDASRVLVHLFRARDDDLDVGAMASILGMERGVLQYHLDNLEAANLAHMTGGNYVYGHTYWGLTPAGRRYVVEQKLI